MNYDGGCPLFPYLSLFKVKVNQYSLLAKKMNHRERIVRLNVCLYQCNPLSHALFLFAFIVGRHAPEEPTHVQ